MHARGVEGIGFEGFEVWGLVLRLECLGFSMEGLGFSVEGIGTRD